MVSSRLRGIVVEWNPRRGFGFVKTADASVYFLHISQRRKVSVSFSLETLSYHPMGTSVHPTIGETITFCLGEKAKDKSYPRVREWCLETVEAEALAILATHQDQMRKKELALAEQEVQKRELLHSLREGLLEEAMAGVRDQVLHCRTPGSGKRRPRPTDQPRRRRNPFVGLTLACL